ncbi:MAG: hypothetical protein MUO96_02190 [Actinobacteria bacterium]|jgi:hypothetical protein|nr:hypothetical protein [Actinomycetota bacterium]
MGYGEEVKKIDTNELRVNLTKYLTENLGDTIYITRYNRLVAEIRVYTEDTRRKTELRIARKMIEAAERGKNQKK